MSDLALELGLPQNIEAERYILGSMLNDGEILGQVCGCLEPEDFALESNRRIFSRLRALYAVGTTADKVILASALNDASQLVSVGGMAYLAELASVPDVSNLDAYIRIVQDKAILRRAVFACQKAIDECLTQAAPTADIIAKLHKLTGDLQAAKASEVDAKRALEIVASMGGADELFTGKRLRVMPTPWERLNLLNGGFERGSMVVIGGRPSKGKSVIAVQIATKAALSGYGSSLIFSIEMSGEQVIHRMISAESGVPHSMIRQGYLDPDQKRRAYEAAHDICYSDHEILIADRQNTIPAIRSAILRAKTKTPLAVITVDYLQLMKNIGGNKTQNWNQELSEISRSLKVLAVEFDVVLIVCSQLSRDGAKQSRAPELHDLRDSGAIESDADVVIFPHEQENTVMDQNLALPVDLLVRKWRNGRLGRVPLIFEKQFVRFVER